MPSPLKELLSCVTRLKTTNRPNVYQNHTYQGFNKNLLEDESPFLKRTPHKSNLEKQLFKQHLTRHHVYHNLHTYLYHKPSKKIHSPAIRSPTPVSSRKPLFTRSKPHSVNKNSPKLLPPYQPFPLTTKGQKEIAKTGFDPVSSGL